MGSCIVGIFAPSTFTLNSSLHFFLQLRKGVVENFVGSGCNCHVVKTWERLMREQLLSWSSAYEINETLSGGGVLKSDIETSTMTVDYTDCP